MKLLLRLTLLSVLLLCSCNRYNRSAATNSVAMGSTPWVTKMASLPPDFRRYLVDYFDYNKKLRKQRPEIPPEKDEEIITDNRRKFEPGCIVSAGFSSILFVQAKPIGSYWVVEYKFGGIASGSAILVFSRTADNVFHEYERHFVESKATTAEKIAAAIALKVEKP